MSQGGRFGPLLPTQTLGVVGGGQLGRMFAQAARRLGYRTAALVPSIDSPAAQVVDEAIVSPVDSLEGFRRLVRSSAAVTLEFENVPAPAMRWMSRFVPVRPGWQSVRIAQDRLREKTFLSRRGIPVAPWRPVRGNEELTRARQELSFPLILKTASSGYDGKGQVRVRDAGELGDAWQQVGRVAAVAEEVVEFLAECSMIVARADDGDTACFPLVQNQHTNHILDASSAPAAVGPHLTQRAQDIASQIAKSLNHVGILTIEYFLTQQGELIVNEFAPRPHNSGHLTIDATLTSQFEQQVRALAGLPLGSTELVRPAAMANLLGDLWIGGEPRWDLMWRSDPDVRLHLYGKRKARPGRKMGHLTVLDRNPEDALARAIAARARLVDRDDSTR